MLRQLTSGEIGRLGLRFDVVATLRGEAAPALEALGVRFHDEDQRWVGPSSGAVVEAPSGEVFALRWFYNRDEEWIWVMAPRSEDRAPGEAFVRFMESTGLEAALVLVVSNRWPPPARADRGSSTTSRSTSTTTRSS